MPLSKSHSQPANTKVHFFYQSVSFTLNQRTALKKFIQGIFKKEGKALDSINFIFCTDKALLEINRQYLKHDFYTDIITFDLSDGNSIQAEVYISIDRVRDNAKQMDVSFKQELHRVVFHGALHLCGYGDKTKSEKEKMREMEDLYLSKYGV